MIGLALAGCASPSGGPDAPQPSVYVAPQASGVRKVAVLPFRAATELIGSSASDIFGTALLRTGRYQLVERSQITGVLGETELAMAGMSDSAAIAAGRMLGAEGVVLGTVDEYGTVADRGKTYPVVGASVRMIDCASGQVLWSVGHSSRSSVRMDTLSGHARRVVNDMITALRAQWHRQPVRAGASNASGFPAQTPATRVSAPPVEARPGPPPPAPDFTVSDLGLRETWLQWPVPPDGYRILVQRAGAAEGPFSTVATVDGEKGRYRDGEGLEDATTYYYRLVTLDGFGQQSVPTRVKESMTAPPPAPPPQLQADAPAAQAVSLRWTASPGEGVVRYRVERRPAAEEGGFGQVAEVGGLEFREGGTASSPLADETGYVYRVRAENRVGAVGPPSAEAVVVTRPPPAAVTGLTATGGELRCVPLLWRQSPEEDVVAYEIYRAAEEQEAELLATVKGRDGIRYLDGGGNPGDLPDAARYVYRVVAVNGVGARSAMSDPVEAATRDRPPMVFGFEAASGLPRRVDLAWMESEDEKVSGYLLSRAEGEGDFTEIARVEGRGTCRFADDGDHRKKLFGGEEVVPLKDGARYRYQVVAVNPAGAVSEVPSRADAVTKAVPPAPSAPEVISGLAGRIEIRWHPAEGDDVGGYVLMAGDAAGEMKDLMRLEGVTAEEKGLEPGRTRTYALRVVDLDGLESGPSVRVSGTTKALPDPPSELAVDGLTLAWTAPAQSDVVKYRIWEKKFLGKSEWGEAEETTLTFAAEEIGKKKIFLIQSVDADGLESELSEPVELRP